MLDVEIITWPPLTNILLGCLLVIGAAGTARAFVTWISPRRPQRLRHELPLR